jgi:hypothetical protein
MRAALAAGIGCNRMAVKRGQGTCVKRKDGLFQASISMGLDNGGLPLRPTAYGKTAADAQASLSVRSRKSDAASTSAPIH